MVKVLDRGKRAQRTRAACLTAGLLAFAPAAGDAVDLNLDLQTVTEAVRFGQSGVDAERRRFHQPYRRNVGAGEIDFLDVVTPYRRVVLAAEDHAAAGDRQFGQRQALSLLDAAPEQIDLHVELTFHPLNVYIGVPAYTVVLIGPDGTRLEPRSVALYSRFTPRLAERPSVTSLPGAALPPVKGQQLVGGTIVAGFDGRLLNPTGTYEVAIALSGKEVARVRLELGTLR